MLGHLVSPEMVLTQTLIWRAGQGVGGDPERPFPPGLRSTGHTVELRAAT